MNNLEEQFKRVRRNVVLTREERSLLRERLMEYMGYRPLPQVHARTARATFSIWHYRARITAFVAIIALVSGGSVSYAAEEAIPGDPLYGVKISINEAVRDLLVQTPEDRVLWAVRKAERRLDEAATLAAEGRLDGGSAGILTSKIHSSAKEVESYVNGADESHSPIAIEVAARLEGAVEAHEEVLVSFTNEILNVEVRAIAEATEAQALALADLSEAGKDAETSSLFLAQPDASAAADSVSVRATATEGSSAEASVNVKRSGESSISLKIGSESTTSRTSTSEEISVKATSGKVVAQNGAVNRLRKLAEKQLRDFESRLEDADRISESTRTQATLVVSESKQLIERAGEALSKKLFAESLALYQEAYTKLLKGAAFLKSGVRANRSNTSGSGEEVKKGVQGVQTEARKGSARLEIVGSSTKAMDFDEDEEDSEKSNESEATSSSRRNSSRDDSQGRDAARTILNQINADGVFHTEFSGTMKSVLGDAEATASIHESIQSTNIMIFPPLEESTEE